MVFYARITPFPHAPLATCQVAKGEIRAAFERALSPAVTGLLVAAFTMLILWSMWVKGWMVDPVHVPTAMCVAFCIATLIVQLVYAFVRDGVPHSSMVGEYYRGYHKEVVAKEKTGGDSAKGEDQAADGSPQEPEMLDHDFSEEVANPKQPCNVRTNSEMHAP
jgi:hypothetical protein